jgi:hypothetical protein
VVRQGFSYATHGGRYKEKKSHYRSPKNFRHVISHQRKQPRPARRRREPKPQIPHRSTCQNRTAALHRASTVTARRRTSFRRRRGTAGRRRHQSPPPRATFLQIQPKGLLISSPLTGFLPPFGKKERKNPPNPVRRAATTFPPHFRAGRLTDRDLL